MINKAYFQKTAVALGSFDGLHRGHMAVIEKAVKQQNKGLLPVAVVFKEHPQMYLNGSAPPLIFSGEVKERAFKNAGISLYELDFGSIKNLSPEEFFETVLISELNAGFISCGYNYRFGKGGTGDTALLKALCEAKGVELFIAPRIEYGGEAISSTRIRKAILDGDIEAANIMLGRFFSYCEKVVDGDRIGRKLGTPTINQYFPENHIIPKYGVYISKVFVDGKYKRAVTNIGLRPTLEIEVPRSETCIIDYSGNLYGQNIEVCLLSYLRPERKFDSLEGLKAQIRSDIEKARAFKEPRL
ncbi:MAG: bifunctional riboflavin kinase/FAD synthetase [Clostridiales bacterium]|jgi:riboflavin kinase/FMN adenylyltransferase|nr:bifunctional riboflavin kinase/FAD synthetase [Clostridiales bacterium]